MPVVGSVLRRQMRDFDRIGRPSERELVLVLPGADGPQGEVVARRVLERLRTIKIEADGKRRPLRISVGLAAWREGVGVEELLSQTRAAAQRAFSITACGRANPSGRSTTTSMPRMAAMCTVAAGTAKGSAFG